MGSWTLHSVFCSCTLLSKRTTRNGSRLDAIKKACKYGTATVLQWLIESPTGREACDLIKKSDNGYGLLCLAVEHGNIAVMEYLHEQRMTDEFHRAIDEASEKGDLSSIKWIIEHCTDDMLPSFRHPIDLSAQYGHLETLKFFHDSESEKIQKLWIHAVDPMYYAAKGGQLAVVEWIHANRSEKCGADAMDIAAGYGHLEVVKWLHSNRTEGCTSSAITSAAARGYLDVELMQWFHANYPDIYKHSRAMYEAARYGQLKVIKWLYENIPKIPTYEAIDRAIRSDHIHVAYWLQSRFPNYVVGSRLEFYKPLVYVNTAQTFETLLYLHVHCTDVFTPLFLRNLREDLPRYHRQMIANWLDEHYPSGAEDYGH